MPALLAEENPVRLCRSCVVELPAEFCSLYVVLKRQLRSLLPGCVQSCSQPNASACFFADALTPSTAGLLKGAAIRWLALSRFRACTPPILVDAAKSAFLFTLLVSSTKGKSAPVVRSRARRKY